MSDTEEALKAEVARLRAGLEFYADPTNWSKKIQRSDGREYFVDTGTAAHGDQGTTARRLLGLGAQIDPEARAKAHAEIMAICVEHDCLIEKDPVKINAVIDDVIGKSQKVVNDILGGKAQAINSLLGKCLGAIGRYKADPDVIRPLLTEKLEAMKAQLDKAKAPESDIQEYMQKTLKTIDSQLGRSQDAK